MRKLVRMLVLVPIVIIGLLLLEEILFWGPARRAQARIEKADKAAIVLSCRELMAQRSSFTNEGEQVSWMRGWVTIEKGSSQYTRLPGTIRDLEPFWVLVGTNEVLIAVRTLPCRVYLHAFAEGARQQGARQLADGLWY